MQGPEKSGQRMPRFLACSCAQRLFVEIAQAIEADAEHGAEVPVAEHGAEVPVAGVLFELDPLLARRQRHERCHDVQAARYAPAWAPLWFPLAVLGWMGRAAFREEYSKRHHQLGFLGNPFEIEARLAEDVAPRPPSTASSDDLLTPVTSS